MKRWMVAVVAVLAIDWGGGHAGPGAPDGGAGAGGGGAGGKDAPIDGDAPVNGDVGAGGADHPPTDGGADVVADAPRDRAPADGADGGGSDGDGGAVVTGSSRLCSRSGWCWVHPLPTGSDLTAVLAQSATDVWVAGPFGVTTHWD